MARNANRPLGDDKGEMENNTPFAERDADAAVSGRVPEDPDLAVVQRALSHIKEALIMEPTTEVISAHAAQFAAAVPPPTSASHARPASPWRRRVIAAVAVAAVSGFGVAGAATANEAAPGDALYSLDQNLERIGILDGGVGERLQEADVLAQRGDVDGAVALTTKALDGDGQHDAALALERAAVAVKSQSSGDDVRLQVSTMLQWMSQQERGADFGAKVSERARAMEANGDQNANKNANQNQNANENANQNQNANGDGTGVCTNDGTCTGTGTVNGNVNGNVNGSADGTGTGICTNDGTCTGTGTVNGNVNGYVNGSADGTGTGVCENDGTCTGTGAMNATGGGNATEPRKP